MKKDRTLDFIRVTATILVVLGHSAFYVMDTSVSGLGVDYSGHIIDNTITHKCFTYFTWLIYSCHMQLFMMLSGMVFFLCIKNGKYETLKELLIDRGKRLIIPYIAVSIIYNVPIYMWGGYFGSENIMKNIILYIVGFGKNHLWFLMALMWISTVVYIFTDQWSNTLLKKILCGISLIIWVALELGFFQPCELLYFDRVLKYLFWFLLGCYLYEHKELLRERIFSSYKKCVLSIFAAGIIWILLFVVGIQNDYNTFNILKQLAGVMFWYVVASFYSIHIFNRSLEFCVGYISKRSMSIYLYGAPLNYLILGLVIRLNSNIYLGNAQSGLLILNRVVAQLVVPCLIFKIFNVLHVNRSEA